ncbi:hypothetical protein JTE90_022890 [Oedothorax gibbosus]|uniref:Uncharacterized protein n=1 Tax=Oedothorax gibbosus TaxID=931172 RepID=A0AAV6UT48_9ARAC|nr:hypothetical protein JTE90_022890 [Oedothorax gibbosus]
MQSSLAKLIRVQSKKPNPFPLALTQTPRDRRRFIFKARETSINTQLTLSKVFASNSNLTIPHRGASFRVRIDPTQTHTTAAHQQLSAGWKKPLPQWRPNDRDTCEPDMRHTL